jgi:hypothetical protein
LKSWMFWLESWHKFKSPSVIKKLNFCFNSDFVNFFKEN